MFLIKLIYSILYCLINYFIYHCIVLIRYLLYMKTKKVKAGRPVVDKLKAKKSRTVTLNDLEVNNITSVYKSLTNALLHLDKQITDNKEIDF